MSEEKKFSVRIVWGEVPEPDDQPKLYEFATQAELDAFKLGIEEADGWMGYEVYEGDFLTVGTKVIWTDPDGGDQVHGEVVGYMREGVFGVLGDDESEIEAPLHELRRVA